MSASLQSTGQGTWTKQEQHLQLFDLLLAVCHIMLLALTLVMGTLQNSN